jgi:HSP20 family protein
MSRELIKSTTFLPSAFDDFFKPWKDIFDTNGGRSWTSTVPAVNITEDKDAFKVSMAAPGMKKEDFQVNVEGDVLTISAEKEETKESNDQKLSRQEYNYSSFSRSFTLPQTVIKDKIEAQYQDGVLKLSIPKNEEAKKEASRLIAIK